MLARTKLTIDAKLFRIPLVVRRVSAECGSKGQSLGRLGFIGCGTITSSVVTGLCTLPAVTRKACFQDKIALSPRNRDNSRKLQHKFPDLVYITEDNQQVWQHFVL